MSDRVITVENLSKKYFITHQHERGYRALRDVLTNNARHLSQRLIQPFKALSSFNGNGRREEFWALKDISFNVAHGEIVGIIGRNGAGKSTLLKVLSRITEPTSGRVGIKGRVASLLEVGTGFHPELTGRENIFLNGAILGMSRSEIKHKFDEIVAFAEVEKFLDTPVKRYSSGMFVRLAFAVAAHLEPEILVVDEVLAVGDAQFQNKCLGKMGEVAKGGRTVLFVSHNMAALSGLCSKALILENGHMTYAPNKVEEAVQTYLHQVSQQAQTQLAYRVDREGEGRIKITHFAIVDRYGHERDLLFCGEFVEFRIYYEGKARQEVRNVVGGIGITAFSGSFIMELSNRFASQEFERVADRGYLSCTLHKLPLAPGSYTLNLIIRQNDIIEDWIKEAAVLTVEDGDFYGTGRMPTPGRGGFLVEQEWSFANSI